MTYYYNVSGRLLCLLAAVLCLLQVQRAAAMATATKPVVRRPAQVTMLSSERRAQLRDSLEKCVLKADSPAERVLLRYHIYDLSSDKERRKSAEDLYITAQMAGDTAAMIDAVCLISNMATSAKEGNDSVQTVQMHRLEMLNSTPEQREAYIFVRINRAMQQMQRDPGRRVQNLEAAMQEFADDSKVDLFRRAEFITTVCIYLGNAGNSKRVLQYLDQADELIRRLPQLKGRLRNRHFTWSAVTNTRSGRPAEALTADSLLLGVMGDLKQRHNGAGRIYRDYQTNYYIVYQRMLGNRVWLGRTDVDSLYNAIQAIAAIDSDVAQDIAERGLTPAYHALGKGQYAQAVPLLQKALANPRNAFLRLQLLQMLIRAAEKAGQSAVEVDAYRRYVQLLRDEMDGAEDTREALSRMMARVDNPAETNAALVMLQQRSEDDQAVRLRVAVFVVVLLMVTGLVWVYVAVRRMRRAARIEAAATKQLREERDTLQRVQRQLIEARDEARRAGRKKDDFISMISYEISEPAQAIVGYSQLVIDSIDGGRRKALEKFVDIIELNARLLQSLVNDVLDAGQLQSSSLHVSYKNVMPARLCEVAAGQLQARLQPGVTMSVKPYTEADATRVIDTDVTRAEQILQQLLGNAVKFTDRGSVTLRYGIDDAAGVARFAVEDTGPGIPEEMHEKIFERFEKLGHSRQGVGLGLYVARMLARLLGGRLFVDPAYKGGTRMVLELPLENKDDGARTAQNDTSAGNDDPSQADNDPFREENDPGVHNYDI